MIVVFIRYFLYQKIPKKQVGSKNGKHRCDNKKTVRKKEKNL